MEKKSFHHFEPIKSAVVSQQKTQILIGFSDKYGREEAGTWLGC
jgi:hypothetical protein